MICPPHFEQVKTSSADGRRDERLAFPKIHRMIALLHRVRVIAVKNSPASHPEV
jgi:hypothetical protein